MVKHSVLSVFATVALTSSRLSSPAWGISLDSSSTVQGDCSDSVSLIQTSTLRNKGRINADKAGVPAANEWVATTPYKGIAAERSEVSSLPENSSIGQLLAYEPTEVVNNDLFVFLPGSWVACSNYTQLLETVAPSMRTVCLPYDNVKALGELCKDDGKCWYEKRLAAHNGTFEGIAGNNIVSRLRTALEFLELKHGKAWGAHRSNLSASGLNFSSIRIAGHSQGAGAASFLAYQEQVARVVQFSGPCDPSEWPQKLKSATPANRFFAMASYYDHFCDWEGKQVPAWWGEGIVSEAAKPAYVAAESLESFDPTYSQTVISMIESPECKYDFCLRDSHDSTALNKWAPPVRAPYAMGLWQKLVGVL